MVDFPFRSVSAQGRRLLSVVGSLGLVISLLYVAPATAAQSPPPQEENQGEKHADDAADESGEEKPRGILAGPEVVEDEEADAAGGFMGDGRRRLTDRVAIRPRMWMRLLWSLDLTDEQQQFVEAARDEFNERAGAFQDEYGDELRRIEQARREARRNGVRLDEETARRARQIMDKSPQFVELQQSIWEQLNETQRSRMQELLAAQRERVLEDRSRRRDRADGSGERMDDGMMMDPGRMSKETESDRAARAAAGFGDGLDEASRRRVRFLRSLQKQRPAGAPPGDDDRTFEFESEEDGERSNGGD